MTSKMFRRALDLLDLTQAGFAELFGIGERTVHHYAATGVTNVPTTILINLLLLKRLKHSDIEYAKTNTTLPKKG